MYWNFNEPTGYKIPVRRTPFNGRSANFAEASHPIEPEPTQIGEPVLATEAQPVQTAVSETDWQTETLRLQAEMENFRKRQTRRADELIAAERERLLRLILPVVDNLERALSYNLVEDSGLHQGVELTRREMMRLLAGEGVTRVDSVGQPFSPEWHEAVATAAVAGAEPGFIVKEVEAGYKLGEKLLRPARVVVAE